MTDTPDLTPPDGPLQGERGRPDPGAVPWDPVDILAGVVDRKAARIESLTAMLAQTSKDLGAARRERDSALATLDRLRSRQPIRVMLRVRALLRQVARDLQRLRSRPGADGRARGRPGPDPFEAGTIGRDEATTELLRGDGPAAFREAMLDRLDGPGDRRLRVISVGTGSGGGTVAGTAASPQDAFDDLDLVSVPVALSTATSPVVGLGADVAFSRVADFDIRRLPRHVVTVALVERDADTWTATPWFDSYDIVVVPGDPVRQQIRMASAKEAGVAPPTADAWPSRDALGNALRAWAKATRIGILVQAPTWQGADTSGDYHFARGLQRQLERRGYPTSVYLRHQWPLAATSRDDALIHLWGRYPTRIRPTQRTILWILYHPELVTADLCRSYDHVFVASDALAADLSARYGIDARSLHQATDAERFRPAVGGRHHELLFVGNSRGVRRTILEDLLPTPHELAVYGGGWPPDMLDPAVLAGASIANGDLPAAYSAADIVLNDHWPEAAQAGLINNRLYDALAAGAFVISDEVPGVAAEFDDGLVTYRGAADLALKVERYLGDPEARRAIAERGRRAVLARHTFAHRVDRLESILAGPAATGRTR